MGSNDTLGMIMMITFEAAIYNEIVRRLVSEHQRHDLYEDVWADLNFIEVEARDEDQAIAKLKRRYPENRGFKITQLYQVG